MPQTQSKDLRHDLDLTTEELKQLLDLAHQVKQHPARFSQALAGTLSEPAI